MMWSWFLATLGIAGLVLAGNKNKVGWALGVLTQVFWIAYAIATKQYGFILGALAYSYVYGRNYLKWRREELKVQNDLLS